ALATCAIRSLSAPGTGSHSSPLASLSIFVGLCSQGGATGAPWPATPHPSGHSDSALSCAPACAVPPDAALSTWQSLLRILRIRLPTYFAFAAFSNRLLGQRQPGAWLASHSHSSAWIPPGRRRK